HVTYPLALAALERLRGRRDPARPDPAFTPRVSLIIAAHDEEEVIAGKLENVLALDFPRESLEIIVTSDGSSDRTTELAEAAGADLVLDLPRGGKLSAQNAAVERASGELLAFSDANAYWEPGALRALVAPFAEPDVGYACGQVAFLDAEGDNQEGAYWRYEMRVRELESGQAGVTAGNGGIYAVRRTAYPFLAPSRSHDLNLPFGLAKAGFRSLYVPEARAEEKLVPDLDGEFERKRRMMRGLLDIVVTDRMLDPRGYSPLYAFQVYSHRVLRYASPKLHALALLSNLTLVRRSPLYALTLLAQLALILAALLPEPPNRLLRLARYYVLVTLSIALGTWDRLRDGPPSAWEKSEGTR
ncbi:MAG TPA: glycosyltransferase family 2 protein, partial [Solirubrobacterales bacterium]|nr:glycosyltransferase family 2 protein [Solirubrobacterales bacterium]